MLQTISTPLKERLWITGNSTIEQAWNSHPQAALVFAQFDLLHCNQCAVRFDESVFEASENYEFSLELFLVQINWLIRQEQI